MTPVDKLVIEERGESLMNSQFRALGLIMGANFEIITALLGAYYGGAWLNENVPFQQFDWYFVTSLLALILIAHSWYVFFRQLIRNDKKSSQDKRN